MYFGVEGLQVGKIEGDTNIESAIKTGEMERALRQYVYKTHIHFVCQVKSGV